MRYAAAAALVLSIAVPASAALDDDDKKWLAEVKPIILEDEQKILESLKTSADRQEFRKIFWARRDPDLTTSANEFQDQYQKRRPEADKRFYTAAYVPVAKSTDALGSQGPRPSNDPLGNAAGVAGAEEAALRQYRDQRERPAMEGALTDCGLFYIVLGEPDDIEKRPHTVWGSREPQSWTYKAKDSKFLFDEACLLPVGNDKIRRQVRTFAIAQPTIDYHVKGGELLKKLADMMPKVTPVAALIQAPRQDFTFTTQYYFMKIDDRTGILGLVRGDGAALFRESQSGGKARVLVRAEATEDGGAGATIASEREMLVEVQPDGSFVASYRLGAKPGKYRLSLAVLDTNSSKGSVASQPLEVPDYGTGSLTIAPILALQAVEEGAKKDAQHPMEAFRLGQIRFVPRYGHVFHPSDAITVSYQYYDAAVDPNTQKPNTVAKIRILRAGGGAVAEGPEDSFDTAVAGTVVGPVSLASYAPGKYKIQLKVMDNVAGKVHTQEAAFEVAPPTAQ